MDKREVKSMDVVCKSLRRACREDVEDGHRVFRQKTSHSRPEGEPTMTVPPIIDPSLPWHEQIDRAEPDLLRSMMKMFVQSIGC